MRRTFDRHSSEYIQRTWNVFEDQVDYSMGTDPNSDSEVDIENQQGFDT